jgi:hypothetical protein
MITVCLVYRAFYGAWQHYHLNGLPDYRYAFKQYLYGRDLDRLWSKMEKLNPAEFVALQQEWKNQYLGEPGAAAKAHRLI